MTVTLKWPGARDDDTTIFNVASLITRGSTVLGADVGGANLDHYDHHDALAQVVKLLEVASEHKEPDYIVYRDDLDGSKWKARNTHTSVIHATTSSTNPENVLNAAGWDLTLSGIDMSAVTGFTVGAPSGGGSMEAGDFYWVKTYTNARGESEIGTPVFANNAAGSQQRTITDTGSWPAGVTSAAIYRTKTNDPLRAGGEIPDYSRFYLVGPITSGGTLNDNKNTAGLGNNPSEPSTSSGGCVAIEMPTDGSDITLKGPVWGHNQQTWRSVGRRARFVAHSTFDNTTGRAARFATATASPDASNAGAMFDFFQTDRIHVTGLNVEAADIAHRSILQLRTKGRNAPSTNLIGGDKSTSVIAFNEFTGGKYSAASVGLPNSTNDVAGATSNVWWLLNRMDNKSSGTNGPNYGPGAGPPSSLDINTGDGHYYINNLTGGSPPLYVNGVAVISVMGGHISGSARGNIGIGGGGCGTLRIGGGMYLDNIQGDNTVNPPTGGGIAKPSATGTANNWSLEGVHFNLNHANCDAVNVHNLKSITITGGDASGCGVPITTFSKTGAGPYTVTVTASGHPYSTGQTAVIGEVVNSLATINGLRTSVTKISASQFSFSQAADPGTYTSGGFTGGNHLFCLRNITDELNGCVAVGVVGGGTRTLQAWWNPGYGAFTGNAPALIEACAGSNDGTGMSPKRGIATLVSGTASITVTHGMFGAPRHVYATPRGDVGAVGLRWWIPTAQITATTFDIKTTGNVGANIDFDWQANQ